MYFFIVIATTIVLPIASALIDAQLNIEPFTWAGRVSVDQVLLAAFGKWYVFWAGGVRLMLAGLRQSFAPGMTLRQIFEIDHPPSGHIVQELGFANISISLICLLSLLYPALMPAGAISAGVFYGLAGLQHIRKRERNPQRTLAMLTDLLVFVVLSASITSMMWHRDSLF